MTLDPSSRPGALGRRFIDIHDERCAAILQILEAGWERVSGAPDVHAGAGEVEITERLRDGMRAALAAKTAGWCRKMTVLQGTESRSSPDVPRPDGRTDLPIFFTDVREEYDEHDPQAIVECKRIAGSRADLCRQYVVAGIDRFADGKYAGNHAAGFLAGYLLSGNAAEAAAGVNRYLTGQERGPEHLRRSTLGDTPWARSSRHPRRALAEPITLHHAFFRLRPAAGAARQAPEAER